MPASAEVQRRSSEVGDYSSGFNYEVTTGSVIPDLLKVPERRQANIGICGPCANQTIFALPIDADELLVEAQAVRQSGGDSAVPMTLLSGLAHHRILGICLV